MKLSPELRKKIAAVWRHPFNSKKRKIYRANRPQKLRRSSLAFASLEGARYFLPKVSIIIPNYNHAKYLPSRLESIMSQNYGNVEIIILDDCSSDKSRQVIMAFYARYPDVTTVIENPTNSGNVFKQWRKGMEAATGEIVWICESDDFCEPNVLHTLVPYFRDRSIQIAFGRIQYADVNGDPLAGLDAHRRAAERGIWEAPLVRPAHEWFCKAFGVNNVIQNVGGALFRNQRLSAEIWSEAETYSVLGDWYLYSQLSNGGQIAYDPKAVAYFRQHNKNTSVSAFSRKSYYDEHMNLIKVLRERWGVPNTTLHKFLGKVKWQYQHHDMDRKCGPFDELYNEADLYEQHRDKPHVLIAFLGFHPGGGEVFPINLANALHSAGMIVSMLAFDMNDVNADMKRLLNPGIAVYDSRYVRKIGANQFLKNAGVTIIHSHMFSLDRFLLDECKIDKSIPYVVTLHGSYEASSLNEKVLGQVAGRVDKFIYTADKNLKPLEAYAVPPQRLCKMRNAMAIDQRDFPVTRQELGISPDAVIFTLVARGIENKGWSESIHAFQNLRSSNPQIAMHLLLCGDGEESEKQMAIHGGDPDITFLGYQSRIHGLYRLSDCALVPTRFAGESFPLCIIQAMQTGTPVIATAIGEIPKMLAPEGLSKGGLLIGNQSNTVEFINQLQDAMQSMLDSELRAELAKGAIRLGADYDIDLLAQKYRELYEAVTREKEIGVS